MDYSLIDADGHYYEPDDCFSRHIEARYRDATVQVRRGADGLGRVFLGGRRTFMSVMPGDYASAPGALQGLFMGEVADGFTHREVINAKDHPEFTHRAARLALMDTQGVEAALMLPTLAVAVEQDMVGDVELTYASLRAFNRWLEEDWGYSAQNRIFAVPMLSLLDLDQAMAELRRVLDAGARAESRLDVGGRSPGADAVPTVDLRRLRCRRRRRRNPRHQQSRRRRLLRRELSVCLRRFRRCRYSRGAVRLQPR